MRKNSLKWFWWSYWENEIKKKKILHQEISNSKVFKEREWKLFGLNNEQEKKLFFSISFIEFVITFTSPIQSINSNFCRSKKRFEQWVDFWSTEK